MIIYNKIVRIVFFELGALQIMSKLNGIQGLYGDDWTLPPGSFNFIYISYVNLVLLQIWFFFFNTIKLTLVSYHLKSIYRVFIENTSSAVVNVSGCDPQVEVQFPLRVDF